MGWSCGNSAVKYFYQNGEFLANDSDWMDEYDDFKYDDYAIMQEEYKYEEVKKLTSNIIKSQPLAVYPSWRQSPCKKKMDHLR